VYEFLSQSTPLVEGTGLFNRSLLESHGKDGFETAERCGVAVLGDRIGLVDPQDILHL
jgi:hypothetical protein